MNLLYLIIAVPLFSFLLLTFIGRHIRLGHGIVIGIGTVIAMALITVFVCIDYNTNTFPDTSLDYYRFLWNWISVGNFVIPIALSLDGLSLTFIILIVFFATILYFFAQTYLISPQDIYTFYAYSNLLIASMLTIILADNLLVVLLGWEGVSLSTYLLVGIYYKRLRNSYAAVKTFIMMHFTDLFLIIGIFMLYNELGTLNIRDLLATAHDNLAIDSDIVFWTTLMLFLGAIGKAGLFPMHMWFVETTLAPMPAVALMQSSTVILSGIYLVLRLSNLFMMSTDVLFFMAVMASLTIIFASTISLVQHDVKRIVTYLNLGQVSYLFLSCATQNWELSLSFLINYTMTSALLILSSSILIKMNNGERDIRRLGGLFKESKGLYICFLFIGMSISALPLISFSFYIKGDIIWGLINQGKLGPGAIGLLGILISTLSISRLIFVTFHNKSKIKSFAKINPIKYALLLMLALFTTALFLYFPLPIEGIIPITDLNTNGQLPFQFLLASVTLLGILIAYIFYVHPNNEIQDIANTPIVKFFIRLCANEWKIEYLWKKTFVQIYLYSANLLKKDPLGVWDSWIIWGIRKINSYIVRLENGQLRSYTVSIVIGSIIMLMLLIFI